MHCLREESNQVVVSLPRCRVSLGTSPPLACMQNARFGLSFASCAGCVWPAHRCKLPLDASTGVCHMCRTYVHCGQPGLRLCHCLLCMCKTPIRVAPVYVRLQIVPHTQHHRDACSSGV